MFTRDTTHDARAAEMADEMCAHFGNRSPFAFLSDEQTPAQRFVGLRRGRLERGTIVFPRDQLTEARDALIRELRLRKREVSDLANAKRLPSELRALYEKMYERDNKTLVALGFKFPRRLIRAWVEENKKATR